MTHSNATSFGQQAVTYAQGRPGYPADLYDWIAGGTPTQNLVWDVGTGSGQAARDLATRFARVHATDVSAAQIAAADPHPKIDYHVAPAGQSGLAGATVDAICVATAVHWFADTPFWTEVARVAKPGALFCAWTYQLPCAPRAVQRQFLDPIYALIDAYWAQGNRICMAGYSAQNLHCPFPIIETPNFESGGVWTAQQLIDFARSWSAHLRAREAGLETALEDLEARLLAENGDRSIPISMPLSLLAARL